MGSYQYAVSTATTKEESDKALSNIVSKDLEALVTFHVTTNVGDLDTEPQIPLKRTDAESAVIEAIRLNPFESVRIVHSVSAQSYLSNDRTT